MSEPVTWHPAPEQMKIADELIAKHHPHLKPFAYRIVFRSKSRKLRGSLTLGTAELITGRFAYFTMTEEEVEKQAETLSNPYQMFWMELAADFWDGLSESQRVALIDHELCHFGVVMGEEDDEPTLTTIPHDLEEFTDIVRRHGLWEPGLENFAAAVMGFEGA